MQIWKTSTLDFDKTLSEALSTYEKHFLCSDGWNLVDTFFIHRDVDFIIFAKNGKTLLIRFQLTITEKSSTVKVLKDPPPFGWSFETFRSHFRQWLMCEILNIRFSKNPKLEFSKYTTIQKALAGLLLDTAQLAKHHYATLIVLKQVFCEGANSRKWFPMINSSPPVVLIGCGTDSRF